MRSERSPVSALSFRAMNGWRGPGSLAIAVGHFGVATDLFAIPTLEPVALVVDLFFVFSGVVIAEAYSTTLSRASAIPEYIVRRFGRIWPLQAATLAILIGYELSKLVLQVFFRKHFSSPAFAADGLNVIEAIPTNLLLIHSLGIHDRETWNFPSWSLSVEFATYGVFAAFCLVAPAFRRALACGTIAGSLLVLMLVAPHHMRSTFDYGLFRCFAGFFAGMLVREAVCRWHMPTWPLPTLVEALTVAFVIAWLALSVGTSMAFAVPFVFCLLILVFAPERGAVSRVLLAKPLQVLADWSFAIYMVHALILIFLLAALHGVERLTGLLLFKTVANPFADRPGTPAAIQVFHVDGAAPRWALFVVYMSCVLLAAFAAYRFVEVPGRVFFARQAKRLRPASAVVAPRRANGGTMEPAP